MFADIVIQVHNAEKAKEKLKSMVPTSQRKGVKSTKEDGSNVPPSIRKKRTDSLDLDMCMLIL